MSGAGCFSSNVVFPDKYAVVLFMIIIGVLGSI